MAANFWTSSQAAALSKQGTWEEHQHDLARGLTEEQIEQITFYFIAYIQDLVHASSKAGVRHRVAATACIFFRRMYSSCDFCHFDPRGVAPGAVYLAAKVEETHLPMKTLFQSMHRVAARWPAVSPLDVKTLVDLEMLVLEKLDFHLVVWHPEPDLSALLESAKCSGLAAPAWAVLNDSYQTRVLLQHPPHVVAIACIVLAAALHQLDVQSWMETLNVDFDQVYSSHQLHRLLKSSGHLRH